MGASPSPEDPLCSPMPGACHRQKACYKPTCVRTHCPLQLQEGAQEKEDPGGGLHSAWWVAIDGGGGLCCGTGWCKRVLRGLCTALLGAALRKGLPRPSKQYGHLTCHPPPTNSQRATCRVQRRAQRPMAAPPQIPSSTAQAGNVNTFPTRQTCKPLPAEISDWVPPFRFPSPPFSYPSSLPPNPQPPEANGLRVYDLEEGSGKEIAAGDKIVVSRVLWVPSMHAHVGWLQGTPSGRGVVPHTPAPRGQRACAQ